MIELESLFAEKLGFVFPWLMQFGYIGILIISFAPIPITEELYIIPFVLASDDKLATLVMSVVVMTVGGVLSHVMLFFAGRHIHRLHSSISKPKMKDPAHIIHKYGVKAFLIIPTISIAVPTFADVYSGALGRLGAKFSVTLNYMIVGYVIRGIVTFVTLYMTINP